jgi:nucleotide-binding universal stress UspA family protein
MLFMVCYDGSSEAKIALEVARKYVKAFDAELLVTTALEGDPKEQLNKLEEAEQIIKEAKKFFDKNDIECETKLLPSNTLSIGENLVFLAEDKNVDKLIMGTSRKSKVGKFVFGSTTQHVILTAPCPVITVK